MKIKVDSNLSNRKEFYAEVYPESGEEANQLSDLIELNESVKCTIEVQER